MRYVVIKDFTDAKDERHIYLAGDKFPREGVEVSEERVAELSSTSNVRGEVLIKAVPEEEKKPVRKSRKKEK